MDWFASQIEWAFNTLKWLIFDFPKPENLSKMANAIGAFWMYAVLFGIIFSETGLLVGFFLPGDSLLFTAGLLCALPDMPINILIMIPLLCVAAVVGDALNYSLGKKMGNRVYEKGNLWFIKYDHLMAAKAFYDKHGGKAIILARFVPLVRTFTPFVAGVARMDYKRFAWFNIVGGIGWVCSMSIAGWLVGYFLGQNEFLLKHFEKLVLLIILVSVSPIIYHAIQHRREKRLAASLGETHDTGNPYQP